MNFLTTVNDTPCYCDVVNYTGAIPGHFSGVWSECFDDSPAVFEFELLDLLGNRCRWLERELTDSDNARLEDEYLELMV